MSKERELHINVIEMKAVELASNACYHVIIGKALILLSNSTTLMADLRKQGGMVSLDMCGLA